MDVRSFLTFELLTVMPKKEISAYNELVEQAEPAKKHDPELSLFEGIDIDCDESDGKSPLRKTFTRDTSTIDDGAIMEIVEEEKSNGSPMVKSNSSYVIHR